MSNNPDKTPPATFYRRCRICGFEAHVPHGPDFHAESAFALEAHLKTHSDHQLAQYVRREHGIFEEVYPRG
jgi:hypothetical protein